MAKKDEVAEAPRPEMVFAYKCPHCGDTAIETSSKMLEVEIHCIACEKLVEVNDESAYSDL